MIYTIIIVTCTIINCVWGFFWIRQLEIQCKVIEKHAKRKSHLELCARCIEVGSCPHNCEVCSWGDVMTERQLNQEKRTKEFYKEIKEYHRRHKHE